MTDPIAPTDRLTLGDKIWKAGQAAVAESSQALGGLAGSAALSAVALTFVTMNSYGSALQAFLVLPTVLATAGLACVAAYKASRGLSKGLSGHVTGEGAGWKNGIHGGFMPAAMGAACAIGLAGSLTALGALGPATASNSAWVALPAIAGSFAALGGIVATTIGGSLGIAMGATMPAEEAKPADIGAKLRERREGATPATASLGLARP